MAELKKLENVVLVNNEQFEVTATEAEKAKMAEEAAKVSHGLTIKTVTNGEETDTTFDGSSAVTIEVGDAKKIQVKLDDSTKYATITISKNDPPQSTDMADGDIWFKYLT